MYWRVYECMYRLSICINVSEPILLISAKNVRTKCILRTKYVYRLWLYQPININMLVLAYLCVYVSAWIYVSVYKNQSYCNRQKFYSRQKLWSEIMQKKCFLKRNEIFEAKEVFPSFPFEAKITTNPRHDWLNDLRQTLLVGSLKMNTTLEYSTRVVQEGDRRCKKSTLNDLAYLTPLRIPLMNPVSVLLPSCLQLPFSWGRVWFSRF